MAPTLWIDSNVLLEFYSHGDAYDAAERENERQLGEVEKRRMRMQGTLWMAMALCELRIESMSYSHEVIRNALRMGPPGTPRGAWTSAVLYMLGDGGVFDGWIRGVTEDGAELSNRDRDRLIVKKCTDEGLPLVTRDGELATEAANAGVCVFTPEEFAALVLPRDEARARFSARIPDAVRRYVDSSRASAERVAEAYEVIWYPPREAPNV